MKRLFGTTILAVALVACGDHLGRVDAPSLSPQLTPTATVTAAPTTTPYDPPKTDPTYAPAVPPILRVRWLYLPDRKTLQIQEDGNPGLLKEARLRAPDGHVVASGTAHLATPGEPRQCISIVVSPPLVAALPVGPDVAVALRTGTPVYALEVRDDSTWYEVELLDWTKIAGGYCLQSQAQ
ncbi:MAG: hypothetical protein E6I49_11510 [Chloroflexi bacterium]|nr:MAG: hypothetical protein E6I49_11510 [Chloroflexota bacterium]